MTNEQILDHVSGYKAIKQQANSGIIQLIENYLQNNMQPGETLRVYIPENHSGLAEIFPQFQSSIHIFYGWELLTSVYIDRVELDKDGYLQFYGFDHELSPEYSTEVSLSDFPDPEYLLDDFAEAVAYRNKNQ